MRARGTSGPSTPGTSDGTSDRAIWERSRETEAAAEETERFLDIAGFVDHRLDEDERERVAALIAHDPLAAADAAAARALMAAPMPSISGGMIDRAVALVDAVGAADVVETTGEVVAFPQRRDRSHGWLGAAGWSSLAAGILLASWLGFNLGRDLPGVTTVSRPYDDTAAGELLDPAPLLPRDATDGSI
jgi:anti-sigma factor RsiW